MTFKPPFSEIEKVYISMHKDEYPSIIAYKLSVLFGTTRTTRGVREQLKKIRE
jgi:hypothetical protein